MTCVAKKPVRFFVAMLSLSTMAVAFLATPRPGGHVDYAPNHGVVTSNNAWTRMTGYRDPSCLPVAPLFLSSSSKKKGNKEPDASSSSNTTATSSTTTTKTTTTTTATDWMDDLSDAAQSMWETIRDAPERYRTKQDLILMGASYDRGFGASPSARQKVNDMIQELIDMNPYQDDKTDEGSSSVLHSSLLQGNWRLVWTTAQDVLALNASPFTVTGAIHQVVESPVITNIIDFIPRAQELVAPDKIRSTLFRGKVKTTATASTQNPMTRIDLTFDSVNVKAVEVLGRKTGSSLPALALNIPKLPGTPDGGLNGSSMRRRPMDIVYLDATMLITKQDAPGGVNVLVKVDDAEV